MDPRQKITLVAYALPLTVGDSRLVALLDTIEALLPGDRLEYSLSKSGALQRIEDRQALLSSAAARGEIPLLCNGAEGRLVTVSGYTVPAVLGPGGKTILDVGISLPATRDYAMQAADILLHACESLSALWAVGSTDATGAQIGAQTTFPRLPHHRPLELPALLAPQHLVSPFVPQRLGWLNYWSAATAQLLGFPDFNRDAELLTRSHQGTTRGWIVKLTEEPLDLTKPLDLKMLKAAYERFPSIGGRNLSSKAFE
jgi:hypothetical protein